MTKPIRTAPETFACNHTPGPWVIHEHEVYGNETWQGRTLVATIEQTPDSKHTANAALIAAAPELLRDAKNALLYIEECFDCAPPQQQDIDMYDDLYTAIERAGGFKHEGDNT